MHLETTVALKTLAGEDLTNGDSKEVLTVATIACNALLAAFEDERNLSGEDKVKRFKLACRIQGADLPVEMTPEEAALIKKLVAKLYGPLVTGQVWELIDGARSANGSAEQPNRKADQAGGNDRRSNHRKVAQVV